MNDRDSGFDDRDTTLDYSYPRHFIRSLKAYEEDED